MMAFLDQDVAMSSIVMMIVCDSTTGEYFVNEYAQKIMKSYGAGGEDCPIETIRK